MLAGALRRSCCRQGTVGTEDCRQGRCSEEPSGRCWRGCRGGADSRGAVAELMAGLGAEAELMAGSAMAKRMAALWQRAIGNMLLAGAPWRSYWPGRRGRAAGQGAAAERMAGRGAVAELLPAAAERHYDTKKKRVTPKPSRTCGSPSCLLTTCYGCLRFAII